MIPTISQLAVGRSLKPNHINDSSLTVEEHVLLEDKDADLSRQGHNH
jgi:hypothetical protein